MANLNIAVEYAPSAHTAKQRKNVKTAMDVNT
jgi:hypothetical protein